MSRVLQYGNQTSKERKVEWKYKALVEEVEDKDKEVIQTLEGEQKDETILEEVVHFIRKTD